MSDFWTVRFTEQDVEEAKERRKLKDTFVRGNRFDSDNRWIGYLGEVAFKGWLDKMTVDYTWWNKERAADIQDFSVTGGLEIDVKTLSSTKYFPKSHHGCQVAVKQLDNEGVDTFVFCTFILDSYEMVVKGWVSKEEFMEKSELKQAGIPITKYFTPPVDMRSIKVFQLRPLSELPVFDNERRRV